jgi:hypothetical protein
MSARVIPSHDEILARVQAASQIHAARVEAAREEAARVEAARVEAARASIGHGPVHTPVPVEPSGPILGHLPDYEEPEPVILIDPEDVAASYWTTISVIAVLLLVTAVLFFNTPYGEHVACWCAADTHIYMCKVPVVEPVAEHVEVEHVNSREGLEYVVVDSIVYTIGSIASLFIDFNE